MLGTREVSEVAVTPASAVRNAMLAIALMSFSALLLELALTRIFSVVLFYHFAFLAISVALLGLGAGAVFAHLRRRWLERWTIAQLGVTLCTVNAVLMVAVLEIVLYTQVSLGLDWPNFWHLTVLYMASSLPFFLTGLLFSLVFARHPASIAQLYGADLLGGALACLALVPLLNAIGGPNVIVFAAMTVALAGAAWAAPSSRRWPLVVACLLVMLIGANLHGRLIDIVYAKGVKRDAPLYARWNALSRVEVDRDGTALMAVIDADANTYIMNTNPHDWSPAYRSILMSAASSVANVLRPQGAFAIIGPGGGVDVLRAVANGSRNVTAIEINPIIANDIMRGRFADYSYHLYQLPEVHLHVQDGRSFVRNSRDKYDVVQMTLVDTWASTAAGAFALSENNLYTVEAFREYFEHLKPDGMIAITRWEFAQPREALRVVSQAMEALREMGVKDSRENFIVVSDGEPDVDGRPVLVLAKRSPFTLEEQRAVLNHIHGGNGEQAHLNLHVLYLPATADRPGMAHPAFAQLIQSQDARAFSRSYAYNVTPVTDNAPFFFFTLKPDQVLSNSEQAIDWKVNLGIAILGIVLVVAAVAVIVFLLLPMVLSPEARSSGGIRVLYFVAIGLGYILVEIAFIQRFVLFLGHPTYALTVVIFLLLLSSGLGSMLSRRWISTPRQLAIALGIIAAVLLVYLGVLPRLLESLVGWPFNAKLLLCAALLAPLGMVMGMPFPSGLRALSQGSHPSQGAVEWAWAMNAGASVLGSVLAIVIAIAAGLNVTLACGAVAYVIAVMLLPAFGAWRIGTA